MTTTGTILIIDDDPLFVTTYQTLLRDEEGYEVDVATDRASAVAKLERGSMYSVVLLDQKLQGRAGENSFDLLQDIQRLAPQAKAIIVTAFATDEAVSQAFDRGAYDYLEKNQLLQTMLRIKVRNAAEVFRDRELRRLTGAERERAIASCWQDVTSQRDPHRKGALLEDLMALVFGSIAGFTDIKRNVRSDLEEIDIIFRNESEDPLWRNEGSYILVECKHWTRPVGARELREFASKLKRRHGRAKLGFFVSMSPFTKGLKEEARRTGDSDRLIVLIDPVALGQLVNSDDRLRDLRALHERAVTDLGAEK